MRKLIFFLFLQGVTLALFCQADYIQVFGGRFRQHIRNIPEGKVVRIKPDSPGIMIIKGKLDILNDSAIKIGGNTLLLKNVKKLWVRNAATSALGGVGIAAGCVLPFMGIDMILGCTPLDPNPLFAFFELLGTMIGGGIILDGVGLMAFGVYFFAYGRCYKTYGKNSYAISVFHDRSTIPSGGK